MARIYKRTDRITVRIDDVVVKLAPLTLDQKTEIQHAFLSSRKETDIRLASKGIALALKYSLKGIEGLEDSDGQPYKLSLGPDENLTDQCIDDLLNLELTRKLSMVCSAMVNGVPTSFTDNENNVLEGVQIIPPTKNVESGQKNA